MTTRSLLPPKKPNPGFSRWLLAPMLLLSLGVHVALLMIPVGASKEAALAPPDPEKDTIAITRVPPTAAPSRPTLALTAASTPLDRVASRALPQRAETTVARSTGGRTQATTSARQSNPKSQVSQQRRAEARSQATRPAQPATASQTATNLPDSAPLRVPLERQAFNPAIHQRLLAYAETLMLPQEQLNQLSLWIARQYTYDAENTSGDALKKNLDSWVSEVRQATGRANLWNDELEQPLKVTSYQRVCMNPKPEPQPAVVGVLVSPSGTVQSNPVLLQSTGYAFLNRAVLTAVKQYAFPKDSEQKAYTVDVNVQVDYGEQDCLEPYPQPNVSAQTNPGDKLAG